MPTENRSNDADGWIACDDGLHLIQMDKNLSHYGWVFRKIDGGLPYSVREATPHEMAHAQARQHLRIGVAQIAGQEPSPQPHPEPIAWMVGTAIWWTKEEAERDAANTGLPIVDLGPMTGAAEVDRLRVELGYMREERDDLSAKLDRFYSRSHGIKNLAAIEELSDKLAERDALLRDKSGDLIRMAAHLISAPLFALQDLQDEDKKMTRARVDKAVDAADARLKDAAYELRRIADALSASAEPSAPIAWHVGGNGYDRICFEKPDDLPGRPCIQAIHDQRQLIDLLKRYDLRDEDVPPDERAHGIPGTSFQRLNALVSQGE
ncbi:hypothetical protein [Pseudomonas sp. BNK-15]|uniref:hypothetical protein n=1 Tax=Pseudomonas sp. BNK-15 TaxID=3376152 RepID=UPI0039BF3685